MTDDSTLKEIERILTAFAQKQKEERDDLEKRITESISIQKQATDNKLTVPDDGFLFDAGIKSITPLSKESFVVFGNKVKELMKQSGIIVVNASLIKKF